MELTKNRVMLIFGMLLFLIVFFSLGMPMLKKIKENSQSNKIGPDMAYEGNATFEGLRPVKIDITIEDTCLNIVTGEPNGECTTSSGCERKCRAEGCSSYGLIFGSHEFSEGACTCNCYEENKIKKALGSND